MKQIYSHLLALDLDGTLLTSDKKLTDRTVCALKNAIAAGSVVVLATGRPFIGIPDELRDFPGVRYAITSNGAVTTDLATDEMLRRKCICRDAALEISNRMKLDNRMHVVFMDGIGYCEEEDFSRLIGQYSGTPIEAYIRKSRRVIAYLSDRISKSNGVENIWILCADKSDRKNLRQEIELTWHLQTVACGSVDLEIGHPDSDKGRALVDLAVYLNIPRVRIIAIGDDENDLGMLEVAGISVAMGNAGEKLAGVASFVTDSNDEDGAAKAIEKILMEL